MSDEFERPNRVLIVDDELDESLWEYAVVTAPYTFFTISTGGHNALRKLDKFNYNMDAAVIDLSMPDMDGLSLTKEIRKQEDLRSKAHPLKIFWCTGIDVPQDPTLAEAFDKYRVVEVLRKPITPMEIISRVHQYIIT